MTPEALRQSVEILERLAPGLTHSLGGLVRALLEIARAAGPVVQRLMEEAANQQAAREPLEPEALRRLLGEANGDGDAIGFTSEGGFFPRPSDN